ncbi:hypothetical protein [Enterococcus hailinensis]|uniref:hypothetical protein n=1 Tax=Enterococcus hailinensis TaxID=3238988 RepID=UPI0038B33C6A
MDKLDKYMEELKNEGKEVYREKSVISYGIWEDYDDSNKMRINQGWFIEDCDDDNLICANNGDLYAGIDSMLYVDVSDAEYPFDYSEYVEAEVWKFYDIEVDVHIDSNAGLSKPEEKEIKKLAFKKIKEQLGGYEHINLYMFN